MSGCRQTLSKEMLILSLCILSQIPAPAFAQGQQEQQQRLIEFQGVTVNSPELQYALQELPLTEQEKVQHNLENLQKLVREVYLRKRLAAEAERLALDKTPSAQIRLEAQRQQILAELYNEHLRQQIGSPDFSALARERYAVRRDQFQTPEQFRTAYIVKQAQCDCERDPKRHQLTLLQNRLKAGEDFAALAKAESEDPNTAAQGGELGQWVKRSELLPAFAAALTKLEIGQVSDIIETKTGLYLIKKLDYRPVSAQDFSEAQPHIEHDLRQNYVKDQVQQKILTYLPPTEAAFNESALRAFVTEPGK